jgi:hypothetical protein
MAGLFLTPFTNRTYKSYIQIVHTNRTFFSLCMINLLSGSANNRVWRFLFFPGTFGWAGLKLQSECIACLPGYYCEMAALIAPTGPCPPGHYCPGGTISPQPCPVGKHFFRCIIGTQTLRPGHLGLRTLAEKPGQIELVGTERAVEIYWAFSWSRIGFNLNLNYCYESTIYINSFIHPAGTYGSTVCLTTPNECTPCHKGKQWPYFFVVS